MVRRLWLALPVLFLSGCEAQICAILGQFDGIVEGDIEGTLEAVLTPSVGEEDTADVSLTLNIDSVLFSGEAKVNCSDGDLVVDLRDGEGVLVGNVTGVAEEGTGHGDYDLLSGGKGTWEY